MLNSLNLLISPDILVVENSELHVDAKTRLRLESFWRGEFSEGKAVRWEFGRLKYIEWRGKALRLTTLMEFLAPEDVKDGKERTGQPTPSQGDRRICLEGLELNRWQTLGQRTGARSLTVKLFCSRFVGKAVDGPSDRMSSSPSC